MLDKYLVFQSGRYIMGDQRLYLNYWSPRFNSKCDVPSSVLVWMKLPYIPLHFWNDVTCRLIVKSLRKYIACSEPKDGLFSCDRICVEVDLDKGLLVTVNLCMDNWMHVQEVDYDQLPFR